jgi:Zn finger protein HypA/HybF involved in hydrogenase expression
MKTRWDVTKLKDAIQDSECWADVCRCLGMTIRGRSYDTLKYHVQQQKLDIGHFKTQGQLMKTRNLSRKWNIETTFKDNTSSKAARKLLIKHNLIEYNCKCGNGGQWEGIKLQLQLDHIDGNHFNNNLDNLRWMCPNCHSQTENFCGKSSWKKIKKSEINPNWRREPKLKTRKVVRPDKETLAGLIQDMGYSAVGRFFDVSDTAVRKWAKTYGILENK